MKTVLGINKPDLSPTQLQEAYVDIIKQSPKDFPGTVVYDAFNGAYLWSIDGNVVFSFYPYREHTNSADFRYMLDELDVDIVAVESIKIIDCLMDAIDEHWKTSVQDTIDLHVPAIVAHLNVLNRFLDSQVFEDALTKRISRYKHMVRLLDPTDSEASMNDIERVGVVPPITIPTAGNHRHTGVTSSKSSSAPEEDTVDDVSPVVKQPAIKFKSIIDTVETVREVMLALPVVKILIKLSELASKDDSVPPFKKRLVTVGDDDHLNALLDENSMQQPLSFAELIAYNYQAQNPRSTGNLKIHGYTVRAVGEYLNVMFSPQLLDIRSGNPPSVTSMLRMDDWVNVARIPMLVTVFIKWYLNETKFKHEVSELDFEHVGKFIELMGTPKNKLRNALNESISIFRDLELDNDMVLTDDSGNFVLVCKYKDDKGGEYNLIHLKETSADILAVRVTINDEGNYFTDVIQPVKFNKLDDISRLLVKLAGIFKLPNTVIQSNMDNLLDS